MDFPDIDFDALPEDPSLAFFEIEDIFRKYFSAIIEAAPVLPANVIDRYISRTIHSAKVLGLDLKDIFPHDYSRYTATTRMSVFIDDIDNFKLAIRIRARKIPGENSVYLSLSSKEKLRHYLDKMRTEVGRLDVSTSKKEALYNRINALQAEVDKPRTRFETFGALVIEGCATVGTAAEKLEPLRKWLDPIGNLIAEARNDGRSSLPPQRSQKQIEGPKDATDDLGDKA